MSSYLKCLISTMVIASLILLLAPDFSGHLKKYIGYVCGLVMMLTLLTPVLTCCDNAEHIKSDVIRFFSNPTANRINKEQKEDAFIQGTVQETAYAIMSFLYNEYGIPIERISVSVITNETEIPTIEELQIYLYNCSEDARNTIQRDLELLTDLRVYVFEKT